VIQGRSDQGDRYGPFRVRVRDDGTISLTMQFWVSEDQTVTFTATQNDAALPTKRAEIVLGVKKGS
jgi:hypothetical protein